MEIEFSQISLSISQRKLIRRILTKFNMMDCKGTKSPMETNFQFKEEDSIDIPYRELIGSLLYISTMSRPDITFAISYLSRFLDKPTKTLWTAAKRILRYIKETIDYSLVYEKNTNNEINIYTDADWGTDKVDRKSTSGVAVYYGKNLIAWMSRKQTTVALSTAEAEYLAASVAMTEGISIKGIAIELSHDETIPMKLNIDNQSAIHLIKSFENSQRSKHIDIKAHFIKDIIAKNITTLGYVPTHENVADIFTKATNYNSFIKFRDKLGIKMQNLAI